MTNERGTGPQPETPTDIERATTPSRRRLGRRWWVAGVVIAALVVIVLAPLASSDPDGLMRIAEDQGFVGQAQNMIAGLLGGYEIPGISDPSLSKVLSGLLGVAILVGLMFVVGRILARRKA